MAIRRGPNLAGRIFGQARNQPVVPAGAHPYGTGATPVQMPIAQVTVSQGPPGYVILGMSDLAPLITADGAIVPATGPGRWDQLMQAGKG